MTPRRLDRSLRAWRLVLYGLLLFWGLVVRATESAAGGTNELAESFQIDAYVLESKTDLSTNLLLSLLQKYRGTNVNRSDLLLAGRDLQREFFIQGRTNMEIVITPRRIVGGVATLHVFPGPVAQVLFSGDRYLADSNGLVAASPGAGQGLAQVGMETNQAPKRTSVPRAAQTFQVDNYLVTGNTLLPPATIGKVLKQADHAFGTNVSLDGIRSAVTELQEAYLARGYVTVGVRLPQQRLTNGVVKLQVTEGRLSSIQVRGNRYFSSNNILSALPSLRTNMILNSQIFQAELNRANANQDRQIYPRISPGPDPGTSDLRLTVVDRLPLHGKVELNNQSSPGTPEVRVNSSAVYDNLWQREHSLGLQYSFSPDWYKTGTYWEPYDRPRVANYSGFYRLPLGGPDSIEEAVAAKPGSFGYDEATRKFNLPPASGQADLTLFASRSTIDNGVENLGSSSLYNIPGVESIVRSILQQDLTENNDLGLRLTAPLPARDDLNSDLAGGLDFKTYRITSYKTNNFIINQITLNAQGIPNPPIVSTVSSPVPTTLQQVEYLPLNFQYDASLRDALGLNSFTLGLGVNAWYSGPVTNLQNITGSSKSSGHWVVINPSYSRNLELVPNWVTLFRADGQWASEPLISNEKFGAGGVNSVRGYREGQVFGDTGWHVSLEQQTPPHLAGYVRGNIPLTIRGSIYMDFAETYLLAPQGSPASTALWGTGFGGVASLGSQFEARFLFSLPLLSTSTSAAYAPFFNFSLMAQF